MKEIYNNSKYYLFEANDYNVKVYNNIILNNKIEDIDWYCIKGINDYMFKEKTKHYNNCQILKKETIDLNTQILKNNILIKIDCQCTEISILEKTDFIILEIPLFGQYNEGVSTFLEHIQFMNSIEFVTYDIIENHYINNFNMQVDIIFINKNHEFNKIVNNLLN